MRIYRQGIEIAASGSTAHTEEARVAHLGLEVMARPLPTVTALSLPGGVVEAFVHNWDGKVTMETAYQTSVIDSRDNVSEERRALLSRPHRTLGVTWQSMTKDTIDRMLVVMRKMSDSRWVMPLYQDQFLLTQDYTTGAGNTTIYCDHLRRRVHNGGRIAIMKFTSGYVPSSVSYLIVSEKRRDGLILDSAVGFDCTTGTTLIAPCLDVEYVMDPALSYFTDRYAVIELTVQEVIGPSALPGSWIGTPGGFGEYDGIPIFDPAHNWTATRDVSYSRAGSISSHGRGIITDLRGDHARLTTSWEIGADRDGALQIVNFFDSRMGRCQTFWTIDPEDIWTVTAVSTTYIDVSPQGNFTDFQLDFTHVGIRMSDGTRIVRPISSFTTTPDWRILVSVNFPAGLSVSAIDGIARARRSRFDSDVLKETWATDDWATIEVKTIEVLEEKEITP